MALWKHHGATGRSGSGRRVGVPQKLGDSGRGLTKPRIWHANENQRYLVLPSLYLSVIGALVSS